MIYSWCYQLARRWHSYLSKSFKLNRSCSPSNFNNHSADEKKQYLTINPSPNTSILIQTAGSIIMASTAAVWIFPLLFRYENREENHMSRTTTTPPRWSSGILPAFRSPLFGKDVCLCSDVYGSLSGNDVPLKIRQCVIYDEQINVLIGVKYTISALGFHKLKEEEKIFWQKEDDITLSDEERYSKIVYTWKQ